LKKEKRLYTGRYVRRVWAAYVLAGFFLITVFWHAPAVLAAPESATAVVPIQAHPALWTIHGTSATAYLFGSVHLLPPNVEWRTPQIDAAMAASETFVFEAPTDHAGIGAIGNFIRAHGMLPEGTLLPSLLDEQTLQDYNKALAVTHVPARSVVRFRPWLAGLVLELAYIRSEHYDPDSGIDRQVYAIAKGEGKSVRYFETVNQQMSLMMPESSKSEVEEFDATLKSFESESSVLAPLIDAWAHADEATVAKLMNADLEAVPGARKALLDDRNQAWVGELKEMLTEPHTFFITVGAGHLAGSGGLPALLRKAGYQVDGP
jgi:uncharacterized protein YbaP (TraB family)